MGLLCGVDHLAVQQEFTPRHRIQCGQMGLLSLVVAGKNVKEYPAQGARPSERTGLVRAPIEYRDREAGMPLTLRIGGRDGVVFRQSRAITMGILNHLQDFAGSSYLSVG